MTAFRRHPVVRPRKRHRPKDATRSQPQRADAPAPHPEFQYSLRAILIGMVLACLTLGAMRALDFWRPRPTVRLPIEVRREIYRELSACSGDKDPKACRALVAAERGIPVEAAELIFQEGIVHAWVASRR